MSSGETQLAAVGRPQGSPDLDTLQHAVEDATTELTRQQVLIAQMVAEYAKPLAIHAECLKEFGDDALTVGRLRHYSSVAMRPPAVQRAVAAIRAVHRAGQDRPIYDPDWRMAQRERIVEAAIKSKDYAEARAALADVERMQGIVFADEAAPAAHAVQTNVIVDMQGYAREFARRMADPNREIVPGLKAPDPFAGQQAGGLPAPGDVDAVDETQDGSGR